MYDLTELEKKSIHAGSLSLGVGALKILILSAVKYGFDRWRAAREYHQDQQYYQLTLEREKELAAIRYSNPYTPIID